MKRLLLCCVLLLSLLLLGAALAEEIPELDGAFMLTDLPKNRTYTVYAGPSEAYHIGAGGKAKVSTNDDIWCYGMTEDGWLLVDYQIDADRSRIGYIHIGQVRWYPLLRFADRRLNLTKAIPVTDDPDGTRSALGMMHGEVTLLAYYGEWAYVEGTLYDRNNEQARGFVNRRTLGNAHQLADMPIWRGFGQSYSLAGVYQLNLPADALSEGMQVYPLSDGTFLIAYHCAGSDRLWLRVISDTGRKLWAKSIPELYLSQITLTETGFLCETFDNSEIDSGVRYTFTCKGQKWTSRKVGWIEENDRCYAYSTEHFTLRRGSFAQDEWMEIEYIPTGAVQRYPLKYGSDWLLCEYEDFEYQHNLLLYDADESGAMTVFRFNAAGEMTGSAAAPFTGDVPSAYGFRNAAYFYVGSGTDWVRWRLDCDTMTFDAAPQALIVPESCTLTPFSGQTSGLHSVLMQTDFGSYLCIVEADGGTVSLLKELEGDAVQVFYGEDGLYVLLEMPYDNGFILQRYEASVG